MNNSNFSFILQALAREHKADPKVIELIEIVWPRFDRKKIDIYQDLNLSVHEEHIVSVSASLGFGATIHDNNGKLLYALNPQELETLRSLVDYAYMSYEQTLEIKELGIDLETFSSVDLPSCGLYKYVESDDFEILLFAYSINGGPVHIVDMASGDTLPAHVERAITDPAVLKTAYNAAFERVCLSKYVGLPKGKYLDPEQWDCTMVRAARLGMPMGLDICGQVLGIERQKMKEGKALIRYFSMPCKPTRSNNGRTRNMPNDAPDKWRTFKEYCIRDVEAEQQIRDKVKRKPVAEKEIQLWYIDQKINDNGVMIDLGMARNASAMDEKAKNELFKYAQDITGLSNPNSVSQLKEFIARREGVKLEKLRKEDLESVMAKCSDWAVKKLIEIRRELGKTSNNKYQTMIDSACEDGRVRGITQFYGAPRTGRWAGRLLQTQNLPQNHIDDIDTARNLVKAGDYDGLDLYYGNVTQTLSELIRTALIAKPGYIFHVCDFSAIECRVLAWLAGEQWVLDTFLSGGDIYCSTASQMFHVPVVKHGENGHLRQKGKIATLACGYGGGVGAMAKMGGERMGLSEKEMDEIVKHWRSANPSIVKLWSNIEKAVKCALRTKEITTLPKGLSFEYKWGGLKINLPSGRYIYYPRMRLEQEDFKDVIVYDGMNQTTKKWESIRTYSGKLTENIIQSIARDCLAEVMHTMYREWGTMPIVFHVHDEIIVECPENDPVQTLGAIEKMFAQEISWAGGLPLKGSGYSTKYYLKD